MIVTIGGLAGSGTSTVSRILLKKLKIQHIDAGQTWDELAKEKNVDVLGLSKLAEKDDTIDRELDKRMLDYARNKESVILEGRLIGALCSQNKIKSFKIWFEAPINIRTKRVWQREIKNKKQITIEEMKEKTKSRDESDIERYKKYYNIDIINKSYYDLIINSENKSPREISELILNRLQFFH